MALTTLCLELSRSPGLSSLQFHAFIVDHKARDGSADEAQLVANRVRALGMYSLSPKMKTTADS